MNTFITTKTPALLGLCLSVVSCGFGQSGIEPPPNRIFFPAGIAVDPAGEWLYVVNSNSDLRFNAGTVIAIDLVKAAQDRADPETRWRGCPTSTYEPANEPPRFCCNDFIDPRIRNCDERGYVAADTTVAIGSFGGTLKVQEFVANGQPARRLFAAVRAEPSLTFVDVSWSNGNIKMRCTPEERARSNVFCDDEWRIKGIKQPDGTDVLFQEEPHPMVLDDTIVTATRMRTGMVETYQAPMGVLHVGHLGGVHQGRLVARGVSTIDICDPATQKPRLATILPDALPRGNSIGVTSLSPARLGDPRAPLYATTELVADIAELVYRSPLRVPCLPKDHDPTMEEKRDLTLTAGRRFTSSAFGTRGADLRGLVFSEDQERAFVLHHQYAVRGEFNPPAVVAIDRRPDAQGLPSNQPTGVVEVCNGPNRLAAHDAGRGPRLFVNCFEGGQIYVVEPNLLNVEAVIELGAGPAELVFSKSDPGIAFVAGFASNNVSVIDLRPGSETEFRVIQRIGFARSRVVQQ